jgi:ferredoxin
MRRAIYLRAGRIVNRDLQASATGVGEPGEPMAFTLRVDKQSCQSSGRCVGAAPGAFALDADHLAEALPGAAQLSGEQALAIARGCPALAIHVLDEAGEEVEL